MTSFEDRMDELREQDRAWFADTAQEREQRIAVDQRLNAATQQLGIDGLERLANEAERIAGGGR